MKPDNQWHEAVVYELLSGEFVIADSVEDAEKDQQPKNEDHGYVGVKYNWNHGQPIVDFGDFQMTIVDTSKTP